MRQLVDKRNGILSVVVLTMGVLSTVFAAWGLEVSPAAAAPITFNTALPVAEGEGILRLQIRSLRASAEAPACRELAVDALSLVGVYGVTNKLALFAIVPILDKRLDLTTSEGRQRRKVSGLGDITLLARYTLFRRDRPGRTFRLAPFLGVEAPSGEDDRQDELGRLPASLQLGSGSWDLTLGAVATWQTLGWQLDAAVAYRSNDQANGFEAGDEARLDVSYQHRLLPRHLEAGLPRFLYGVLESNLVWTDQNRVGGLEDLDSGGFIAYLAPGVQLVSNRLIVEATVQVPVAGALHGSALEPDFVAILSTRVNL
jgi:hypothetical protein